MEQHNNETIERNDMIVAMWSKSNLSLRQIADTFNVSYGTVVNVIHKHVEYSQGTYGTIWLVNKYIPDCQYSPGTVTRAWMALRRYYPNAAMDEQELKNLTLGAGLDNNIQLSAAVENLLTHTIDFLKKGG